MAVDSTKVRTLFLAAIEGHPAERWPAFLNQACGGDADLRARVEQLLEAHRAMGSFHPPDLDLNQDANPSPSPSEGPGSVIGPYKLLEPIGEGGMGTVYMAEQERPVRRKVALKIIKAGMDTARVIARFEAERQALALMDHPNIAKVLDAGATASGRPFFVMELVKGVPITRFCDEQRLSLRERLELLLPVCHAVQHAHQKGIIHRDLKPSNVLVVLYDDRPAPQVIDFGVAKATGDRLTDKTLYTGFGAVVGTLEYMSPEQARLNALDVDTRSDVYALGVLLYELLTGSTPFQRERLAHAAFDEMLRIIREDEHPKPSELLSGSGTDLAALSVQRGAEAARLPGLVRGELDWIVMKCLEKDRARRYETADGLARDLQRYLAGEPVEAGPSSTWYRLKRLALRRRRVLTTASAFVLILVLASVVSIRQAVIATRAQREARAERDRALAAERLARTEQDNAQAALEFLWKDVLSQASYRYELDRDLKVRTLIDRVAERLDRGPTKPPTIDAAVRQMVGAVYIDLGEYSQAQPHLEAALDVHRRELGEDDPRTLATMHHLGHCLYRRDREEAVRLLERTLELRRRVLGDDHDDTLFTARLAAACLGQRGRIAEAEALLRRTLEARRRVFGEQHGETLVTTYWLAGHQARQGKLDEAEALALRCLEQNRGGGEAEVMVALSAQNTLVDVYLRRKDPAKAEPLALKVVEGMRRYYGDQHSFTLKATQRLVRVYHLQGRYEAAAPALAEALAMARKAHDGDHPYVISTLQLFGKNCLARRRYAEAETYLRQCLSGIERERPGRLSRTVSRSAVQGLLGESLMAQARYAEAEPLLLANLEALRASKDDDPEAPPASKGREIAAVERIARLYEAWGKPGAAPLRRVDPAGRAGPSNPR